MILYFLLIGIKKEALPNAHFLKLQTLQCSVLTSVLLHMGLGPSLHSSFLGPRDPCTGPGTQVSGHICRFSTLHVTNVHSDHNFVALIFGEHHYVTGALPEKLQAGGEGEQYTRTRVIHRAEMGGAHRH